MSKIYTEEQKLKIVELRKQGLSFEKIAKDVGVKNITTVMNTCETAGLPKSKIQNKIKYEIGQRYFNFVLIERMPNIKQSNKSLSCWKCLCDCNNEFVITSKQLGREQTSCGCLSIAGSKTQKYKSDINIFCISNELRSFGYVRYSSYRYGAKTRKLTWELLFSKFVELLVSNCYYCGSEPYSEMKIGKTKFLVNGVDRINNKIGYVDDNCVSCCKICNRAKLTSPLNEFETWIKNIIKYRKNNENMYNI